MITTFKRNRFTKTLIIGCVFLSAQMLVFHEQLSPVTWGQIKVEGQACTCPDEKVISGRMYLRYITPDSLKKYELNFAGIFVTERPASEKDPMGADRYIMEGEVIGKERGSDLDPWSPLVRVTRWREASILKDWLIKVSFLIQVIVWTGLLLRARAVPVIVS